MTQGVPRHWMEGVVTGSGPSQRRQVVIEKQEDGQLFLYFWPPGKHAFISRVYPARVEAAETSTLQFKRPNTSWRVTLKRTEVLAAIARLTRDFPIPRPLAGLSATPSLATTRKLTQLLDAPLADNELVVRISQSRILGATYAPGRFSWDAKDAHFDFISGGKRNRITVARNVEAADAEMLVPASVERLEGGGKHWRAKPSEFAGTAHSAFRTTMPERAAWNTVNVWAARHYLFTGTDFPVTMLQQVALLAEKAWARITGASATYYLLPQERQSDGFFAVYRVQCNASWHIATQQLHPDHLGEAQRDYLLVAWDAFESGGRAPLQGLKKRRKS